ncbi:LLM class flavin-dependent oxidoreductase [Streptomyces colonosanans]|uniref:Luciferase n=1 Tax=Streptomyces colonosanans TaxID=1428652 RepID=A0A1S2NUU1_9ACTN|nr:LLM class flavin-dependent oxidoreductase [Streptomyces colonosanans]OIJ84985.1 luciferase [Streptomyces colonosanans]
MRVGVLVLPEKRWAQAAREWRAVEKLGFDSAWTYDHLSWSSLADGPWFSAFPVLTAAACATSRIFLGTLVTSPNFRHPVTTAKDAIALDDISGGRFVLGVGAGSVTAGDAQVLTSRVVPGGERTARFEEFVELTNLLLRQPVTTYEGKYFRANGARMYPGCLQRPRLPLAVASAGRRGMALTARHGDAWVTTGPANWAAGFTPQECLAAVTDQITALRKACERVDRDPETIDRIFVATDPAGNFLESPDAFLHLSESYAKVGITHLVVHCPRAEGVYAAPSDSLERIAEEALPVARDL